MPTSAPYAVPIIASVARQLRPQSVLDVGVGFGKYGFLFREYCDIWEMNDLHDYRRQNWRTRIEGIEATRDYLTPLHDFLYDAIHIGDAVEVIDRLDNYDVIIMADVLEHFVKPVGQRLVRALYQHANMTVLLTFPEGCDHRPAVFGNPHEQHLSSWDRRDFKQYPGTQYKLLEDRAAVVAIPKPGVAPPLLTPCFAARRRSGWRGMAATTLVSAMGPSAASRFASWLLRQRVTLRT